MNEELHINPTVSALVMLAAIVSTWSVYSTYKDDQVATEYENEQANMEQTANTLVSLRLAKEQAAATVSTTTTTAPTKSKKLDQ